MPAGRRLARSRRNRKEAPDPRAEPAGGAATQERPALVADVRLISSPFGSERDTTCVGPFVSEELQSERRLEYRGIVECTADPCTYCRKPRTRNVINMVYSTPEGALDHAWGLAVNVYGASTHRALVQVRPDEPWQDYPLEKPRRHAL